MSQIEFALVRIDGADDWHRRYFVLKFKARWTVVLVRTERDATNITLSTWGEQDPRTANHRYGLNMLTKQDGTLLEDGPIEDTFALIPRNFVLSISNQAPYRLGTFEKYTLKDLIKNNDIFRKQPGLLSAYRIAMTRFFDVCTPEAYERSRAVLNQQVQRLHPEGNLYPQSLSGTLFSCVRGASSMRVRGGAYDTRASTWKAYRSNFNNLGETVRGAIKRREAEDEDVDYEEDLIGALRIAGMEDLSRREALESGVLHALEEKAGINISLCECGHFEKTAMAHWMRGSEYLWCDPCFSEEAVRLQDLGRPYWPREDAYLCEEDGQYYSYDRDAQLRQQREEDPVARQRDLDRQRALRQRAEAIMDYGVRVTGLLASGKIKSSPHGDFLMGIELEMTSGEPFGGTAISHVDAALDVRERLGNDYCIIKRDGSLPANGMEIVTAPRGLAEHIGKFKTWEVHKNYRAWDVGSCGLHVHIHSKAFNQLSLGKFMIFMNRNENAAFIRKIAGRHPLKDEQARRYAATEQQHILINPKQALKNKSFERYRIVNTQNLTAREGARLSVPHTNGKYDTVEVRIFRASLNKARLLAQIEFAHALVMFCRVASIRELDGQTFLKWLRAEATAMYPHLCDWYGTRRSKAVKDAGDKPLQDVCVDRLPDTAVPVPRPTREQFAQAQSLITRRVPGSALQMQPPPATFPAAEVTEKMAELKRVYGPGVSLSSLRTMALEVLISEHNQREMQRVARLAAERQEQQERETQERAARLTAEEERLTAIREEAKRARAEVRRARRLSQAARERPRDEKGRFLPGPAPVQGPQVELELERVEAVGPTVETVLERYEAGLRTTATPPTREEVVLATRERLRALGIDRF
jgi:hypothetical protein